MTTFLHQVKTKKLVVMFSLPFSSIRVQNCISAAHTVFACVTHSSLIDTTDMSKSVFWQEGVNQLLDIGKNFLYCELTTKQIILFLQSTEKNLSSCPENGFCYYTRCSPSNQELNVCVWLFTVQWTVKTVSLDFSTEYCRHIFHPAFHKEVNSHTWFSSGGCDARIAVFFLKHPNAIVV